MATPDDDTRQHILVVNDDDAILALFKEILTEEGYRVTIDNFSRQVRPMYERVREQIPDLVIVDFLIGGETNGWQVVQTLRMDRAIRNIPLIICTGAIRQIAELREQLDALSVEVVHKPFDIDQLVSVVRQCLSRQG